MIEKRLRLGDPEVELTDEESAELWRAALRKVRARAAATGDPIGAAQEPASKSKGGVLER